MHQPRIETKVQEMMIKGSLGLWKEWSEVNAQVLFIT
jgi:hypothetical protein